MIVGQRVEACTQIASRIGDSYMHYQSQITNDSYTPKNQTHLSELQNKEMLFLYTHLNETHSLIPLKRAIRYVFQKFDTLWGV